jgi:hypothetical protein
MPSSARDDASAAYRLGRSAPVRSLWGVFFFENRADGPEIAGDGPALRPPQKFMQARSVQRILERVK